MGEHNNANVKCDDCITEKCEIRQTGKSMPCVDFTPKSATTDTHPYPEGQCPHRFGLPDPKCIGKLCIAYQTLVKPRILTDGKGNMVDPDTEYYFEGCGLLVDKCWVPRPKAYQKPTVR